MSAIWGMIDFTKEALKSTIADTMELPFHKYMIDRFERLQVKNLLMGCAIQYITKESFHEQLPIYDEHPHIYLTADCVLDNREELLDSLALSDSATPDGELILHAYKKWKEDCTLHLRGFFSFAIYDETRNLLILATDQVSGRCLYYFYTGTQCYFSTLLNPIVQVAEPKPKLNEQFICDSLALSGLRLELTCEETPYENIHKVEAGHYMLIDLHQCSKVNYWNPYDYHKKIVFDTPEQYGAYFLELIKECVATALRTQDNIGISMSSGLDSSTIGCIAASMLKEKGQILRSYTYVPLEEYHPEDTSFYVPDESLGVRNICKQHTNIIPSFLDNKDANAFNKLESMMNILEIPYKAVQNIPALYNVFQHAHKDHCRIMLNGHFGNVTISQGKFKDALYELLHNGHMIQAIKLFNRFCLKNKYHRKMYAKDILPTYFLHPLYGLGNRLLKPALKDTFINSQFAKQYSETSRLKRLGFNSPYKTYNTAKEYHKYLFDTGSMSYTGEFDTKLGLASGLLIRDPSKDIRIIEFCADLPMNCFVHNETERWLIRGNMQDYVPREILFDIFHRGEQSADWMFRLNKEWDKIYPELNCSCKNPQIAPYLNLEKIEQFFQNNKNSLLTENERDACSILYISALSKYINSLSL